MYNEKLDKYYYPVETIPGQIIGKANNYEVVPDGKGGKRLIKNAKIRRYEKLFNFHCTIYRNARIDTHFELRVDVYMCNDHYDLDNSLKTLLDCLQYCGAIVNDNLCRRIVANKRIDPYKPRVEFAIIPDQEPRQLSLFEEGKY